MPGRKKKSTKITRTFVTNEMQKTKTMEKSRSTTTPTEYAIPGHSSHTMDELQKDDKHCDAVIEAGGQKFKIHKSVFAIYSDYFDKVFTVEMQEKYDSVVKLESTRSDVMKCIVDLIYSGKLLIDRDNAVELLMAADYLRIEIGRKNAKKEEQVGYVLNAIIEGEAYVPLLLSFPCLHHAFHFESKEFSARFLLQNVNTESCVGVWICARTYDLRDLLEKSATIFGEHFSSVSHDELCWLNNDQFLEIMETTKGQPLITASLELLQKVVVELMARLKNASDKEEKANRRIAELEKAKQVSSGRIGKLQGENDRLTERYRVSVRCTEQAQSQCTTASRIVDSLANESKQLKKQLELSVKNFRHAEAQLQASAKTVDSLTNESKQLKEQLKLSVKHVQHVKFQLKASEKTVNSLTKEKENIFSQIEKITSKSQLVETQELDYTSKVDEPTAKKLQRCVTTSQQAEKQQKVPAKEIKSVTKTNERLSERVQKSVITSWQYQDQQKVRTTRNDELTLESEELIQRVRQIVNHAQQAELQLKESQDNIRLHLKKQQELSKLVHVYSNAAQQAENKQKELEVRVGELSVENRRLTIQGLNETHSLQKVSRQVIDLKKRIGEYVKETQALSFETGEWSRLYKETLNELMVYGQNVDSAINLIRSLLNGSTKLFCFRRGTFLSNDDRISINEQLTQICSN